MILKDNEAANILRNLTPQDFLSFGVQDVAYIKPVSNNGKTEYVVHGADGTPLSVVSSVSDATMLIHRNDMEKAILH